jgi:hypothetical protein
MMMFALASSTTSFRSTHSSCSIRFEDRRYKFINTTARLAACNRCSILRNPFLTDCERDQRLVETSKTGS